MKLLGQGRKFFLSMFFMVQGLVLLGLSYALALDSKLVPEWVQLVTMWLPIAGFVTGAYAGANAYVSGKEVEKGIPTEDRK
jgi:hypothetical protein